MAHRDNEFPFKNPNIVVAPEVLFVGDIDPKGSKVSDDGKVLEAVAVIVNTPFRVVHDAIVYVGGQTVKGVRGDVAARWIAEGWVKPVEPAAAAKPPAASVAVAAPKTSKAKRI